MTDRNFAVISSINCKGLDNTCWSIDCFDEETSTHEYFDTIESVILAPGEYIIIYSKDGGNDDFLESPMTRPDCTARISDTEKYFFYKMD